MLLTLSLGVLLGAVIAALSIIIFYQKNKKMGVIPSTLLANQGTGLRPYLIKDGHIFMHMGEHVPEGCQRVNIIGLKELSMAFTADGSNKADGSIKAGYYRVIFYRRKQ
jgi:hypothetical protein